MTTFWKSNPRHYCEACGCWIDAKPSQIKKHEEGFRHKGNVIRRASKAKRDKFLANKEANKHAAAFAAIERAAKHQYVKDCANGTASFQSNAHRTKRRKDKPTFLGSDDEEFYYLDKMGTTHGPYPASTMVKWLHFGFFVGALRIRKRTQSEFIHLKDIQNPFNYSEFQIRFHSDALFRQSVLEWMDISNANCVPPGIEIPNALKQQFFKMYPTKKMDKKSQRGINENDNERFKEHKYFSNGVDFKPQKSVKIASNDSNARSHKEQRQMFIRGQMRKYKAKSKYDESDCNLEHNVDKNEHEQSAESVEKKVEKREKDELKNTNVDEFGFGKWENVSKEEFDKKHSNEHLIKAKNKKKRWWRDQINANLPSAKRKRLMGIETLPSDEEGDYDKLYGFDELIDKSDDDTNNIHKQYKQSTEKIAISIGSRPICDGNSDKNKNDHGNEEEMNEENVLVRDAKLKLKALKEEQMKIEMKKKEKVIEELDEYVNDRNVNQIDDALRIRQIVNGKQNKNVSFKKKKKKKRKLGKIGIDF